MILWILVILAFLTSHWKLWVGVVFLILIILASNYKGKLDNGVDR